MLRSRWPNIRALIQKALKCSAPAAFQPRASVPTAHSAQIPLHALILHTLSTAKESPLYHLPASPTNNVWKWVKPILTGPALWAPAFTRSPDKDPHRGRSVLAGAFCGQRGTPWRASACLSRTRTVQLYLSCRCVPSLWFLWPEEEVEEECGVTQHWCALRQSQEVSTALILAGGEGLKMKMKITVF